MKFKSLPQAGTIVNVIGPHGGRPIRLQGGKVIGCAWVHMGEDGSDIGRWPLIQFPHVADPVVIAANLLEEV